MRPVVLPKDIHVNTVSEPFLKLLLIKFLNRYGHYGIFRKRICPSFFNLTYLKVFVVNDFKLFSMALSTQPGREGAWSCSVGDVITFIESGSFCQTSKAQGEIDFLRPMLPHDLPLLLFLS